MLGQEAEARQQLFNRIAPAYDEVGVCVVVGEREGEACAEHRAQAPPPPPLVANTHTLTHTTKNPS